MNSVDNIKSVAQLIRFYKNKYQYGVLNRQTGQAYPDKDDQAWRNWRLNTPQQTLNSGTGNCYDTIQLSKKVLDNLKVPYSTYFEINKQRNGVQVPSHSFLVYKDKDKYKWLQGSWGPYKNNKYTSRDKQKLVRIIARLMSQTAKADQQIFQLKIYRMDLIYILTMKQTGVNLLCLYRNLKRKPL